MHCGLLLRNLCLFLKCFIACFLKNVFLLAVLSQETESVRCWISDWSNFLISFIQLFLLNFLKGFLDYLSSTVTTLCFTCSLPVPLFVSSCSCFRTQRSLSVFLKLSVVVSLKFSSVLCSTFVSEFLSYVVLASPTCWRLPSNVWRLTFCFGVNTSQPEIMLMAPGDHFPRERGEPALELDIPGSKPMSTSSCFSH